MKNKLLTGVMLEQFKQPALSRKIKWIIPRKVYIPLHEDSVVCVDLYTKVKRAQPITEDINRYGHPDVISPVDGLYKGTVVLTDGRGNELSCAYIQTSDEMLDGTEAQPEPCDYSAFTAQQMIEKSKQALIIDEMDGEYLYQKLERFLQQGDIQTVVVNAVDDEPYLSSAMGLLYQVSDQLSRGLEIAQKVLGVQEAFYLVYSGAYDSDVKSLKMIDGVKVKKMKGAYPQRDQVEDRMNGYGKCAFIGAQALVHLYRAVATDRPHTTCFITVAGDCVSNPRNIEVPIGTLVEDVLDFCGLHSDPGRVVIGGAMRGEMIDDLKTPLTFLSRAVLALPARGTHAYECVGCSRCQRVCPAGLIPSMLYKAERFEQYDGLAMFTPERCIECGACAYICPSKIDLLHYIKKIKNRSLSAGQEGENR